MRHEVRAGLERVNRLYADGLMKPINPVSMRRIGPGERHKIAREPQEDLVRTKQ